MTPADRHGPEFPHSIVGPSSTFRSHHRIGYGSSTARWPLLVLIVLVVVPSPSAPAVSVQISNFLTAIIGSVPTITVGPDDSSFNQIILLVNAALDGVDSLSVDVLIAPLTRSGPGSLMDQLARVLSGALTDCTQIDRMISVTERLLCIASIGVSLEQGIPLCDTHNTHTHTHAHAMVLVQLHSLTCSLADDILQ